MYIHKGDQVKILSGKDRGKTGAVLKADPRRGRVTVEGQNLFKKRAKPKRQGQKGETVLVPRPIHVSSVQIVCQSCKRATRIGSRAEDKTKTRYCKKCEAAI